MEELGFAKAYHPLNRLDRAVHRLRPPRRASVASKISPVLLFFGDQIFYAKKRFVSSAAVVAFLLSYCVTIVQKRLLVFYYFSLF